MANSSGALRHAPARSRPAPRRSESRPSPPELGVLDRRQVLERARRRQARALVTLSVSLVAAALVLAAAGHGLLASEQLRADTLGSQIASRIATQQNEQLQRAQLEAPSRILSVAEHGLKMVTPASVTYLPPVNPGPSVAEVHGAPSPNSSPAVTSHGSRRSGKSASPGSSASPSSSASSAPGSR